MDTKELFFENIDRRVCTLISKILPFFIAVFPLILVMSLVGIWETSMKSLIAVAIVGVIGCLAPMITMRLNMPIHIAKYISIIGLMIAVYAMASDKTIGVYLTNTIALAVSCMYFDMIFTRNIAFIGYIPMIVALYFHMDMNLEALIGRGIGYTAEYIIMSVIYINLAKAARKLLENLQNTQSVKVIVKNCEEASESLVQVVDRLAQAVDDTANANQKIMTAVDETIEDCNKTITRVNNTSNSIEQMKAMADTITTQSQEMIVIADSTTGAMQEYVRFMDDAVNSMKTIKVTSNTTSEAIDNLTECMQEISTFADAISNITTQTNLLALNASIEAARAGENGRGFAVVAEQVRVLAEQSKVASGNITSMLKSIDSVIENTKTAITDNKSSVVEGIQIIHNVKQRAEEICNLQGQTKDKAKQVFECSNMTKQYSEEVASQAEAMAMDVQNTLNQTNEITEATKTQSTITSTVGADFQKVHEISKNLLAISSQMIV